MLINTVKPTYENGSVLAFRENGKGETEFIFVYCYLKEESLKNLRSSQYFQKVYGKK